MYTLSGASLENFFRLTNWANFGLPCCRIVQKGRQVIIASHHNTLRALVKHLDNIPDKDIRELKIPHGKKMQHNRV